MMGPGPSETRLFPRPAPFTGLHGPRAGMPKRKQVTESTHSPPLVRSARGARRGTCCLPSRPSWASGPPKPPVARPFEPVRMRRGADRRRGCRFLPPGTSGSRHLGEFWGGVPGGCGRGCLALGVVEAVALRIGEGVDL